MLMEHLWTGEGCWGGGGGYLERGWQQGWRRSQGNTLSFAHASQLNFSNHDYKKLQQDQKPKHDKI